MVLALAADSTTTRLCLAMFMFSCSLSWAAEVYPIPRRSLRPGYTALGRLDAPIRVIPAAPMWPLRRLAGRRGSAPDRLRGGAHPPVPAPRWSPGGLVPARGVPAPPPQLRRRVG